MIQETNRAALAIRAEALSKCYHLYGRPADRLKQLLWRGRRRYYTEFWALRDVDFELQRGGVLGVIGRNGAGKSTLLQLVSGTLTPTAGRVERSGRIAALLELGAGFNPEFTGRENVFLNAATLGLSRREIRDTLEDIIDFSGIREFIDQPVKTYSSGMFVRLAFSVATAVKPDVLIVDEALAVGDGAFARKSFDRILELRDGGTAILFCSHALYQVEALCSEALWLEHGRVAARGRAADVTAAYRESLEGGEAAAASHSTVAVDAPARIAGITLRVNGEPLAPEGRVRSRQDTLSVGVSFIANAALPAPSLAVSFSTTDGRMVCGVGNVNDGQPALMDAEGKGRIEVAFRELPLLKGRYRVNVVLACERALHVYESVDGVATIEVMQSDLEQGLAHLPHVWNRAAGLPAQAGAPG